MRGIELFLVVFSQKPQANGHFYFMLQLSKRSGFPEEVMGALFCSKCSEGVIQSHTGILSLLLFLLSSQNPKNLSIKSLISRLMDEDDVRPSTSTAPQILPLKLRASDDTIIACDEDVACKSNYIKMKLEVSQLLFVFFFPLNL